MTKKQKLAKQWESRTCMTCQKKFNSTDKRAAHEQKEHRPPVNQASTGSGMEYSKDKHITDLQTALDKAENRRRKLIDVALSCIQEALRAV